MKVLVESIANSTPGKNPLLETPQYAAQLAGSSIFFQVISKLDEHPVRVILHDKYSGERLKLTIERSGEFKPIEKVVVEKPQPTITKVIVPVSVTPTAPPPALKVPLLRPPSLTPGVPKTVAPAPKAVPSGATPAAPKQIQSPKLSIGALKLK
jgi:hypothetical protein